MKKQKASPKKKQKEEAVSAVQLALETAQAAKKLAELKWNETVRHLEDLSSQWKKEFKQSKKEITNLRKAKKKAEKKAEKAKTSGKKNSKKNALKNSGKSKSKKSDKQKPASKSEREMPAKKVIKVVATNTYPAKKAAKKTVKTPAPPTVRIAPSSTVKSKVEIAANPKASQKPGGDAKQPARKRPARKRNYPVKSTSTAAGANSFRRIEGIGPKIEELIKASGIKSFEELGKANINTLRDILKKAGSRYNIHDPGSWAQQARLAAKGQWEQLKAFQEKLRSKKR